MVSRLVSGQELDDQFSGLAVSELILPLMPEQESDVGDIVFAGHRM